jgi:CHAD domain-containing protein
VREHLERELKLAPGEGFVLPELGGQMLPTRIFVSTYHDTPDLRLARNGVTFRHRVEDGAGLWQLKLARGAARVELVEPGPPARPPAALLALLPALLRGRELVAVARLRTRREGVRAQGAEIVADSVAVLEAQHVVRRFRELEVELLDGDERTLRRLEKALRRAGAGDGPARPKLYRALDLAWPAEPLALARGTPVREALAATVAEQLGRLLAHDPGTRLGGDPEDLHQLRVATRRLRAFLRAARPLLEAGWAEGLRAELRWLGQALGPARDLDVLVEYLEAELGSLDPEDAALGHGLVGALASEREAARASVLEALSSPRYLALLDRIEAAAEEPRVVASEPSLREIWWAELRRTRTSFARLGPEPADEELHAARIRVKRARYAAELAGHELGERGAAFVAAAKRLQDVLGDHQDAVVAEERVRSWAARHPEGAVAAGRLVERQRLRRVSARRDWPAAWAELLRRARRARA